MTRQDFLFKWFWYAMALLPVWLFEDLVFSRVHLLGVSPVLLPLAAVAVAVLEGPVAGAGFGLGVGLLCSAAWLGEGSWVVLALALVGTGAGAAAQYGLKQSFISCLLCSAGGLALLNLLRVFAHFFAGRAALAPLLRVGLAECLVSLIFVPFVYGLFRAVYAKVGGTKLM